MGITTALIEDGRIFVLTVADPWTIADLVGAEEADKVIRDNSSFAKVHCLIDARGMHKMPPGALLTGRRTPSISHPTAGYVAVVGANSFVRAVSDIKDFWDKEFKA